MRSRGRRRAAAQALVEHRHQGEKRQPDDRDQDARLQEDPGRDMAKMRQDVGRRLESYGWVDEEGGIAHIPIDRAMRIAAQGGLPARDGTDGGDSE